MRICFLFISLLLLLKAQAEQLKVSVSAAGAVLINADTGVILFEKEGNTRFYPASTTKIATAFYALSKKGDQLEQPVIAPSDAVQVVQASHRQAPHSQYPSYRLEHDGSHIGIKVGEELSLEALLHGLMLRSGNDAANVIAGHISGSIPQFMEELNRFLATFGVENTHFNNPHGLYHPEHFTTPSDLAKIAQAAMRNSQFRAIVKKVTAVRPRTNKQEEAQFVQTNRLLKPGKLHYPKAIGIKTGYTFKAGNAFVGAAEHEGRTLIAVLMKCPNSESSFQDAVALFEAAFSEKKQVRTLFAKGYDAFATEIKGSKVPLSALLDQDLSIEYYPAEEPQCQMAVEWHPLKLPVVKGAWVGDVRLINAQGETMTTAPLFAANTLSKPWADVCLEYLRHPLCKGGAFLFVILGVVGVFHQKSVRRKKNSNSSH